MTTLNRVYSKEGGNEKGMKVNKTFIVPLNMIYIEDGFNVRDICSEHVDSIAAAYNDGKYIPAIVVKATELGFKIIDGHHRFHAAKKVGVERLECKDFVGDEKEMVAMMVTSSQGRNLSPLERAKAYQRLKGFGLTDSEISKQVNRSLSDIKRHMTLMSAPESIIKAVEGGLIGFAAAVDELSKHGGNAEKHITKAIESSDGKPVTRETLKSFNKKDYTAVMEILCGMEFTHLPSELTELIRKYQS